MSDMTGGSSVVRSFAPSQEEAFNMSDANAVVSLLRRVHQLPVGPDEKNELRDAVFSHQTSGKGVLSKEMIEQFAAYNLFLTNESDAEEQTSAPAKPSAADQAVTIQGAQPTVPKQTFGRPTPSFKPVAAVAPVSTPAAPTKAQSTPQAPVAPTEVAEPVEKEPEPVATKKVLSTPAPTAAPETQTPTSTPPAAAAVTETQVVPEEPTLSTAPVTPDVATQEATEKEEVSPVSGGEVAASAPLTDPNERIKAIKREVNALVGNPVNLIDVNNEVGREYMNALLDAMKKVSVGDGADSVRAMARLETAFSAVKETLANQPVTPPAAAAAETTKNDEVVLDLTSDEPSTPSAASATVDTAPPTTPQAAQAQPAPATAAEPPLITKPAVADPVSDTVQAPESPEANDSAPTMQSVGSSRNENLAEALNDVPQESSTLAPATPTPDTSTAAAEPATTDDAARVPIKSNTFTAVGKERQLKDLMAEKVANEDSQAAAQAARNAENPLMASDVNSGLEQLLSEWKLFKSSGLFGTGPSGIEHPLYKQLANLTMAAVLAGRFEGATGEVKKSVADYMNGWRYEEGISHEPGETFEHYLRRVIRHILDRSKKTAVAK